MNGLDSLHHSNTVLYLPYTAQALASTVKVLMKLESHTHTQDERQILLGCFHFNRVGGSNDCTKREIKKIYIYIYF